MSNTERGFNRRRFLRSGIPVALGVAGVGFAGVTLLRGLAPRGEVVAAAPETPTGTPAPLPPTEAPKPTATAASTATGTASPTKRAETPTAAVTATGTATVAATAPATGTATGTASPTKKPETPTVEVTKPPEKPVLGDKEVYTDGKTTVLADVSLPDTDDQTKLKHYLFLMGGDGNTGVLVLQPNSTGDNSFDTKNEYPGKGAYIKILKAEKNGLNLSVELKIGGSQFNTVELQRKGVGSRVLLDELKKVKTIVQKLGPNGIIPDDWIIKQTNDALNQRYGTNIEYLHL